MKFVLSHKACKHNSIARWVTGVKLNPTVVVQRAK